MQTQEMTACVLDDEKAIGTVVCRVLQSCSVQAVAFEEPDPFIAQVEASQPSLVFVDLSLGKSDAIEVIHKLEAINYQGNVVLMSGQSTEFLSEITQVGMSHGLSMLPPLKKPFRQADVKARLGIAPIKRVVESPSTVPAQRGDLAEALEHNWLELWYQPKIDLKTFSVCGAEALVRVNHPQFGVLSPGEFLPPAGDPLYGPLSSFVLERAILDWNALAAQNLRTKIAINMPASIVLDPAFISNLREQLPIGGSFSGLIIEITEGELLRDEKAIREMAIQLRLSKVELSIDDFGQAHSSLARLRDLPCSELKLDKGFVFNCSKDETKRDICQMVVDLARKFELSVCAEGVENQEDLRVLVGMGFDTAQGYLFAKPMRFDAFMAMSQNEKLKSLRSGISPEAVVIGVDEYQHPAMTAQSKNAPPNQHAEPGMPFFYWGNK